MTRYVLAELLKVFCVALTGLTLTIMLVGVVKEAISQGLPPYHVMRLIPYILPDALRFSIPVTLLLAVTTVYSRMSGFNEVVALKALGISPVVLVWPALAIAFLLSLVSVWLNDVAVSWGRSGVQQVVLEAVDEIVYGMLRTDMRYNSKQFSINVSRVENRRLIRPIVTVFARGSTPTITIEAEHAELFADQQEKVLKIVLYNGRLDVADRASGRFNDRQELEIPLTDASRAGDVSNHPSFTPLWQIPEEVTRQLETIAERQQEAAVRTACSLFTGEFGNLGGADWIFRQNSITDAQGRLFRLRLEPYRRWSAGFSCFCFVWVGVPMGIWLRKREPLTSFFLCFAPILAVYYPLLIYGINGSKNGTIPPISVWAGNFVLLLWGVWAMKKVLRY